MHMHDPISVRANKSHVKITHAPSDMFVFVVFMHARGSTSTPNTAVFGYVYSS